MDSVVEGASFVISFCFSEQLVTIVKCNQGGAQWTEADWERRIPQQCKTREKGVTKQRRICD